MESCRILYRIDDFGRIAIPKEIRRAMRIKEGDPLEIYTTRDGEIVFRKYSPLTNVRELAQSLCTAVARNCETVIAVTACGIVIAVSEGKRELLGERTSPQLEQMMKNRCFYQSTGSSPSIFVTEAETDRVITAAPIISQKDVLGEVLTVRNSGAPPAIEAESLLVKTLATFLEEQIAT